MERHHHSPESSAERRLPNFGHAPFVPKNGCCRKCMKAFSTSGKSCLCQVPKKLRTAQLGSQGCKICGCKGCSPQDTEAEGSYSLSQESVDLGLDNVNSSLLGRMVAVEYKLQPAMLGLGIPQRTPNYILGKPL